jgi:hypothetical protein
MQRVHNPEPSTHNQRWFKNLPLWINSSARLNRVQITFAAGG